MMDQEILPENFVSHKVSKRRRLIVSLGVLLAGIIGMKLISSVEGKAGQREKEHKALLVEVLTLVPSQAQSVVEATGTLSAVQQVSLVPEVSGRVVWVSDRLQPGAAFNKGEVLARIDSSAYEALLAQESVRLKQSELELALERERAHRAGEDWARLGDESKDGTLAKRTHHLALAEANFTAAQAAFGQAERNVERTKLRAPFNAVVVDERLNVGQVVGPALQVANLAGRDRFRSTIQIPVEQIEAISIPGVNGVAAGEGSTASLHQDINGDTRMEPSAIVVGLGGQLDPMTRMATLLIDIVPSASANSERPLLLGSLHQVRIQGKSRKEALRIPRAALYDGEKVWTVNKENKLQMTRVRTGWDLGNDIEILEGLSAGDRIVISPLRLPIEGKAIRLNNPKTGE